MATGDPCIHGMPPALCPTCSRLTAPMMGPQVLEIAGASFANSQCEIDYKILVADSPKELSAKVVEALRDNYKLVGGITATNESENHCYRFFQAVVKETFAGS